MGGWNDAMYGNEPVTQNVLTQHECSSSNHKVALMNPLRFPSFSTWYLFCFHNYGAKTQTHFIYRIISFTEYDEINHLVSRIR